MLLVLLVILTIVSVDGDIPAASMKAQSTSRQTLAAEDTRKSVDVSGRWRERAFIFDPAKHTWGELCHKQHDRDGGQSVREQANNECVDCRWERTTAYKERQRSGEARKRNRLQGSLSRGQAAKSLPSH